MPRRRREGQPVERRNDLWRRVAEPRPGARVRGYVRFSHAAGHYGLTVLGQRQHIADYCAARGWMLDGVDEEPATSAKYDEIEDRPVFARHLRAAETGQFDISLCYMNDRWARNVGVAVQSLARLRRAGVWWATTDDRWTINRVQEDGFDIAWLVDCSINAAYSRKVSEKTRAGRLTRAREGLHNGDIMYGYTRVPDPPRPLDVPAHWQPPRRPAVPHPVNFARLQQIGVWAASGMSDRAIAQACNERGWLTQTAKPVGKRRRFTGFADGRPVYEHERVGPRPFSKDTITAILVNPYPREFAPGTARGTILTPPGERIAGLHRAAFGWDLWHRIDEQRQLRRGSRSRSNARPPHAWVFSGYAICAACGAALYADGQYRRGYGYYRDARVNQGLPCPVQIVSDTSRVPRSVREEVLEAEFARLFLRFPLPDDWRERIAAEAARAAPNESDERDERDERDETNSVVDPEVRRVRREALLRERERLTFQHQHGFLDDAGLLREGGRINEALGALDATAETAAARRAEEIRAAITAGETLAQLGDYWELATRDERGELVRLLLQPQGLVWDFARQAIVAIRPRAEVLPVLRLAGLVGHGAGAPEVRLLGPGERYEHDQHERIHDQRQAEKSGTYQVPPSELTEPDERTERLS